MNPQPLLFHPNRPAQPRRALIFCLVLAVLLTAYGCAAVSPTPPPAETAAPAPTFTPTLAVPTNTPAPTFTPTIPPTPTPDPCPSQPERWTLNLQKDASGNIYRNNYRLLTPTCAYDNLMPWLAFTMAIQNGYSPEEAAHLLGLQDHPYFSGFRYNEGIPQKYVYWFHLQAEESIPVRGLWYLSTMQYPLTSRFWVYNNQTGDYTPNKFVMHGCTPNVKAGLRDGLGNEEIVYFPMVCSILKFFPGAQDRYVLHKLPDGSEAPNVQVGYIPNPEWAFNDDPNIGGGHNYAKPGQPAYATLLFYAYTGNGQWWYLGEDDRFELRSFISVESMKNNIEFFHEFQPELLVWDIQWLKDTYGIEPRPLPERAEETIQRFKSDADLSAAGDEAFRIGYEYRLQYSEKNLKK